MRASSSYQLSLHSLQLGTWILFFRFAMPGFGLLCLVRLAGRAPEGPVESQVFASTLMRCEDPYDEEDHVEAHIR